MTLPKVVYLETMSKSIYIGVSSVARKVKKIYVGVSGVARKVKKGYIGVGGVAKLFYSASNPPSYYGRITSLSSARQNMAASSNANYAIFGGGQYYSGTFYPSATVAAYNSSLARTDKNLTYNAIGLAATNIGNYVLFGGGRYSIAYPPIVSAVAYVTSYDLSLTSSSATNLNTAKYNLAAASVGNYALFAGGSAYNPDTCYATVDTYNSSLTHGTATNLNVVKRLLCSTSNTNYAIFGGGSTDEWSTYTNTVDAYDSSLTRTSVTTLTQTTTTNLTGASTGNYGLICGSSEINTVNVYDLSLVKTTTNLSEIRYWGIGCSLNGNALFAGGLGPTSSGGTAYRSYIDVFDSSLSHVTIDTNSNIERYDLSSASIGDYALFAGGYSSVGTNSYVDAVKSNN